MEGSTNVSGKRDTSILTFRSLGDEVPRLVLDSGFYQIQRLEQDRRTTEFDTRDDASDFGKGHS